MKETKIIMGMPITIEIVDLQVTRDAFDVVFDYFKYVDEKFSTYKINSEINAINSGKIKKDEWSKDMQEIFKLAEKTKMETKNYFDIQKPDGTFDPSGLVKGWAIHKAGILLKEKGYKNFCIEAGGDIETFGKNNSGQPWTVGIRNPFKNEEIIKVLEVENKGIATSGTYIRGQHIYNPNNKNKEINEIVSLTVVGPDIYEADRFATAAFAMGRHGIIFIESLSGFEGYMVDQNGMATMTSHFEEYVQN